jgi:hypothetical protein
MQRTDRIPEVVTVDVAQLASIVVGLLVPFLKDGAEKLRDKLSEAAADEVTSTAGRMWERVKGLFTGDPEREAIIGAFDKAPAQLGDAVAIELRKMMEADPALAREFEGLVATPVPGGTTVGTISVQVSGGTNYGNIGGIQNITQIAPER